MHLRCSHQTAFRPNYGAGTWERKKHTRKQSPYNGRGTGTVSFVDDKKSGWTAVLVAPVLKSYSPWHHHRGEKIISSGTT